MQDLIKKWRGLASAYGKVGEESSTALQGVIAGAMGKATMECIADLEAELNEREKNATDNGFRAAPARYVQQDRETIDRIRDAMTDAGFVAFCLGTAMRYEDRGGAKGDPDGDAEKARWYRQMIRHVSGDGPDPRADRPGFVPYRRIGGE